MAKGFKTGGRQRGTPNRTTQAAKDAIAMVAAELGGAARMVEWVRLDPLNERAFWTQVYPKLLPLTLNGDPENPIESVTRIELIPLGNSKN